MKKKILFALILLINTGLLKAQWADNLKWDYDFGTEKGEYIATEEGTNYIHSNSKKKGFLPKPISGETRVVIGGGTSTGGSFVLNGDHTLTMNQPNASLIKFSGFDIAKATPVVKASFKINFDSDLGTYTWAIGNNKNKLFKNSSNVYRSSDELFAALHWKLNPSGIAFSYREGSDASSRTAMSLINTTTFEKGNSYDVEVYCNNSSTTQEYQQNSTSYSLPKDTYHIWVNGVKIGDDIPRTKEVKGTDEAFNPKNSIALLNGTALNSFCFISSNEKNANGGIILSNINLIYNIKK